MVKILLTRTSYVAEIVKREFCAIFIKGRAVCRERKRRWNGRKKARRRGHGKECH